MAIAFVQSASKAVSGVNNTTLAFAGNVTAGNWLAASQGSFRSTAHTITTPIDTLGHTYLPMTAEQSVSSVRGRSFYAENSSGGANTVTFDLSDTANGQFAVAIGEFSGVKTSSSLDTTNVGNGTGTALSSGDVTPSAGNALLYAAATASSNSVDVTEEAGWTLMEKQIPAAVPIFTEFKIQGSSPATEDADATAASNMSWIMHVAVFQEAGQGQLLASRRNRLVG